MKRQERRGQGQKGDRGRREEEGREGGEGKTGVEGGQEEGEARGRNGTVISPPRSFLKVAAPMANITKTGSGRGAG